MLWCEGAQNIEVSNCKIKSALKCTLWSQCTPVSDRQRQTEGRTDRRTNIMAIAQWFVLTNASRAKKTRAHQEMRYPNVTWHISYLFTYLPLNYDPSVFLEYFLSNAYCTCYISNGRRFTKSALCILSTFRVSSTNYSLVCSLPIHTWNS